MALLPWRNNSKTAILEEQILSMRTEVVQLRTELTEARTTYAVSPSIVRNANAMAQSSQSGQARDMALLYEQYRSIPWISAPLDAIARRITSGGWQVVPAAKGGNPANKKKIEDFLLYCNDDEDFNEMTTLNLLAMMIFGRCYDEIVWAGSEPAELYFVNPATMSEKFDAFGNVSGYVQVMPDGSKVILKENQILRVPIRGPTGDVLSPLQKLMPSAAIWQYMTQWGTRFFQSGAKPLLYVKLPEGSDSNDADRITMHIEQNYMGTDNNGRWPVMFNGSELVPLLGSGGMEMDWLQSRKMVREELLAVLGVPPVAVGVADDGNRLTDMSEQADKQFRYNTIDPLKRQYCEKFTYKIIKKGMGIDDWALDLHELDYRGQATILEQVIAAVNAGLATRDEARPMVGFDGKVPRAQGGGGVAAVSLTREIVPVSDLTAIHGQQFLTAQQQAIQTGLLPAASPDDLAKASPRDPMVAAKHPVTVNDKKFDANQAAAAQKDDKKPPAQDQQSLDALRKWRKCAMRDVAEGKPYRVFETDAIDAILYYAVAESLNEAQTADEVRSVFDGAFEVSREELAWQR